MFRPRAVFLLLLIILSCACVAQDQPDKTEAILNFPSRFFTRIQQKTVSLNDQLTHQTEKYLQRMQRREQRLYRKLYKIDSSAAKNLFADAFSYFMRVGTHMSTCTIGKVIRIELVFEMRNIAGLKKDL